MSWLHTIRGVEPRRVALELGLTVRRAEISRCLACGAKDGVKLFADGARWHCHHCQAGGDGADMVALALTSERLARGNWDLVRDWYAARGWCEAPAGRTLVRIEPLPLPDRLPDAPAGGPPPLDEVMGLLRRCRPVDQDPGVAEWLGRRGLGPAAPRRVSVGRLAVALPPRTAVPDWAARGRWSWPELGYRLLVPMYDAQGRIASVRARCVDAPTSTGAPKALPPTGYSVRGLVMASQVARRMLRGEAWPADVVVAEGEPQWLAACLAWPERAVLGVVAGSWTPEIAARVPRGASVMLVTDHGDRKGDGDRYAARISETLTGRRVSRLEVVCG